MKAKLQHTPVMGKTQRVQFEKTLKEIWQSKRRFYARKVPEPTDKQVFAELKNGTAKMRKAVFKKEYYHEYIEKFFIVPCLEKHRKREDEEQTKADKRAASFDKEYYAACDLLAKTESCLAGAAIVETFHAQTK